MGINTPYYHSLLDGPPHGQPYASGPNITLFQQEAVRDQISLSLFPNSS
jgi:hypothetical protein